MAASPAKSHIVAQGFGGMVLQCDTTPGPASYDDLGQRFVFCPPSGETRFRYAIDVERRGVEVPDVLARATGKTGDSFHEFWTLSEVTAKLADVPILELLKTQEYTDPTAEMIRLDTESHFIAIGRTRR